MGGDTTVRLAVFNNDGGWATEEKTWNRWSDESVEAFVSEIAGIPPDEAREVAARAFDGWRQRGGETEARGEKRKLVAWLVSVFGLATLGGIAIVAILVVLVIQLL
jgi:hypothetical protein